MASKDEKYTFNTKLYECCSTDELRPMMQCIHFKNGFAYASNAHVAIKQTLEFHGILNPEMLDGKSLHRDSFKAIMGFEIAEANDMGIECKNKNGQTAFFDYFNREDRPAPDIDKVIKDHRGLTNISFIGFDPEQFSKLSKALHAPAKNIRVRFTGIDSAMLVDVIGVEDQQGIIMPVILNDSLF